MPLIFQYARKELMNNFYDQLKQPKYRVGDTVWTYLDPKNFEKPSIPVQKCKIIKIELRISCRSVSKDEIKVVNIDYVCETQDYNEIRRFQSELSTTEKQSLDIAIDEMTKKIKKTEAHLTNKLIPFLETMSNQRKHLE